MIWKCCLRNRSVEEQYNPVSLKDIEKEVGTIPKFDHSVKWRQRVDRPPRNPLKKVTEAVRPPSLGGARLSKQTSSSSSSSGQALPSKRFKAGHDSDQNMETEADSNEVLSNKSL